MDCNFDWKIQFRFGPDVIHINNFDKKEEDFVKRAVLKVEGVFIDKAFVGDGTSSDNSMIGVYGSSVKNVTDFWCEYNKL